MVIRTTSTVPPSHGATRRLLSRRIAMTAALLVVSSLASSPVEAIIFLNTPGAGREQDYNTTAPTHPLTGNPIVNSGWEFQGLWQTVQGTAVGDSSFLTAKHIKGTPGQTFTVGGESYTTLARVDAPDGIDLALWQVDGTFDSFAPLYTGDGEAFKNAIVFGRGFHIKGDRVEVDGQLKGWEWEETNPRDLRLRWGRNRIERAIVIDDIPAILVGGFDDRGGVPDEAHLSSGDSGGGLFIEDDDVWKLAGVNSSVLADFRTTADGDMFKAAIFDAGGLFVDLGNGYELVPDGPEPIPSVFFSTRVSPNVPWINDSIAATHRWTGGLASGSWGSASSWQDGIAPRPNWIATLANTTVNGPQQALVEANSTVRQINIFGHTGEMNLTLLPNVSLTASDVINIDGGAIVRLQSGATLGAGNVVNINAGAIVEMQPGATLQATNDININHNAVFEVPTGATLRADDLINIFRGTLRLQSGATLTADRMVINNGQLSGSGTVDVASEVLNVGVVAPATGALLTIGADYRQRSGGTLRLEFSGIEADQFSQLNVVGRAQLADTLELVDAEDFATVPGDEFEVLFYGERSGQFDTISNPDRPGLTYQPQYGAGSLRLSTSAVEGDANLDGQVDATDLDVMAINWKRSVGERGWVFGDFNDDGTVNLIDLVITADHWQVGVPAGAASPGPLDLQAFMAAVPEPSSAALLIAALPFLLLRRPLRKSRAAVREKD